MSEYCLLYTSKSARVCQDGTRVYQENCRYLIRRITNGEDSFRYRWYRYDGPYLSLIHISDVGERAGKCGLEHRVDLLGVGWIVETLYILSIIMLYIQWQEIIGFLPQVIYGK